MSSTLVVDTSLQATQQASDFSVLGFKSILPTSTNTPEELTIDTFRNGVRPLLLSNPLVDLFAPGNAEKFLTSGTLTTDRATIGTQVNKTTGLIETIAIDTIREEAEGFLIEGASTNPLLRSEEFDNAAWTKTDSTITPSASTSPTGAVDASELDDSTGAASGHVRQDLSITDNSEAQTLSCFFKKSTSDIVGLRLALVGGTAVFGSASYTFSTNTLVTVGSVIASVKNIGNGWFRVSLTAQNNSTGNTSADVRIFTTDPLVVSQTGDAFIWGAQLEQLPFASSYIKTTTISVTRTADDISIDAANIPALTADYSVLSNINILGFVSGSFPRIYEISGTSLHTRINSSNSKVTSRHLTESTSTSSVVPNLAFDHAFTVGSVNQTLYFNGTQEDQDAKGVATGTKTGINIGRLATSQYLFGHISDFMIFERALNQLEIVTIQSGAELPATNSSEEDPLFPFVNTLDFRDNTKYSPLVTSGTVVIEFNQSVVQPIDYFAFAIHNSQDAGLTGKLEVDTGAGFEIVAEFASVKNNRPFLKFFGTKNTQRQKLTLNFNSKLFIGTIFLGEAVVFNRTPSLNFQPGRTAPLDTVEQFTTDAGNNFIIGRRINRGFNEKSTFRFIKFDDLDLFYEDFQNHVLDSKSVFFKWSNTKNQTIFGLQNARTMTKPTYETSFHADISFDISGYT